jgi:DNA modification methylase
MIEIIQGNNLDSIKSLESESINTCVTSPPYWGLRDYGTATWVGGDENCSHFRESHQSDKTITGHKKSVLSGGIADSIYKSVCKRCGAVREDQQLGLEETPEAFVENLVVLFREIRRVLRQDGTVWLNLGDSYCGTGHKGDTKDPKYEEGRNGQSHAVNNQVNGLKNKDLVGIPWRVAFALQQDGWYLRQDIIWHKPNPMPESVRDRCTKSHEYIFLLSKNNKYYYDNESIKEDTVTKVTGNIRFGGNKYGDSTDIKHATKSGNIYQPTKKRNKRTVWTVSTKPYKGAHFATFPMDLIEPCVLAGCPEKVCADCGEPYTREVETVKTEINTERKNSLSPDYIDGKKIIYQRPELVSQKRFVDFLRSKASAKYITEKTGIVWNTTNHWFRYDSSGFSYPTVEDWEQVKYIFEDDSEEFNAIDYGLTYIETTSPPQWRPKVEYEHIDHGLQKNCDCETDAFAAGKVLDPFGGAATTGIVADNNNRDAILLELNPEYVEIAHKRIKKNSEERIEAERLKNMQPELNF